MAPLDPRRQSHQCLCYLMVSLMLAGPATPLAAQQTAQKPRRPAAPAKPVTAAAQAPADAAAKIDPRYIAPGACVIVALRPAQFFSSPLAEWLPTEILQAASVNETGLDPLQAEQFVISYSPPTSYAAFATFKDKVAIKEGQWTQHTQASTLAGKPYLKSMTQMEPSFYMPTERSLLLAPDFLANQMASDKGPPITPITAKFVAAAANEDVLAIIDVAAMRPLLKMGLAQAPVPPEAQALQALPDLIKTVELRLNLSHSAPSEAIITADDETDAEQIVAIFEHYKQLLADQMAGQTEQMLSSEDPVEQAMGRYTQRMSKTWDSRLQLVREGDKIVLFRADLTEANMLASPMVIGVLVALLLPAVQAAREAARRNAAMNNLRQIMLGLLNYESAHASFPAHASYDANGKPLLSWRVHILPYLEQQALYDQFHLEEPWDSDHNKTLVRHMPPVFLDPNSRQAAGEGKSNYLGVEGDGYFFDGTGQGRGITSIEDGLTNTIAIVQIGDDAAAVWTQPDDWSPGDENPLDGAGGLNAGDIFLAGFCDGHVQPIYKNIDPTTFVSMLTAAGGEIINNF